MTTQTPLLSDSSQQQVRHLLEKYVAENKIAGAVAVVAGPEVEPHTAKGAAMNAGPRAQFVSVGVQDVDTQVPTGPDTIFRIYSLTKPVTSVAALMLVERGLLRLDDAVADYIPAFADVHVFVGEQGANQSSGPGAGANARPEFELPELPPTVRDLLMHTSGIGGTHMASTEPMAAAYRAARFDDRGQTLEQLADKVAEIPLLFQPGRKWRYGISTDVLARVVEVASGQSFGAFLRNNIFEPLHMHDTDFCVDATQAQRLATMYTADGQGTLRPLSGPAHSYRTPPTLEAGSSGLVSTPRDYLNFAQMMLGNGTWRGKRLLNPETIQSLATNQLPPELLPYRLPWPHTDRFTDGAGFGLGVRVLLDPEQAGVPGSVGEYGWAGAANTFLWVDPVRKLVVLLFTQAFPFLHTDIDVAFKRLVYESMP